ncbi:hypothetical protein BJ878DRAFT_534092 [Calycina marina]|uniref:Uncharacterized protein n=1 Tax=Calycina marina TaxID=1763456 RepID=A0A9P7Z3Y1_9HELO|nr:hypothetical protein BJ878DRAFT_534092 [Calycina marina]
MHSSLIVAVATLSAAPVQERDTWGGAFLVSQNTSRIVFSVTTIIPGTAPSTQAGETILDLGLTTLGLTTLGVVQRLVNDEITPVAVIGLHTKNMKNRCIRCSLFGSSGGSDGILTKYTRSADTSSWMQVATNVATGAQLSTYTHTSGPMNGWRSGIKCGTKTLATSGGTTDPSFTTADGGKTWMIARINIPRMYSGRHHQGESGNGDCKALLSRGAQRVGKL